MDKDKWIEKIREKLLHHPTAVPDALWDKIEGELPTPPAIRLKRCYLYVAASVAALLVVGTLTMLLVDKPATENSDLIAQTTTTDCETISHTSTSEHIATTPATHEDVKAVSSPIMHTYIALNSTPAVNQQTTKTTTYTDNENTIVEKQQSASTNTITQQQTTTETNDNKENCKQIVVDTDVPLINYCNKNDSCEELLTDEIIEQVKKNEDLTHWLAFEANTSGRQSSTTPFSFRNEPSEVTFNHNMPLNVKVLFEKRLGKWSIGTGVSYTYMTAHYEMANNLRNGKQELHYVGIPLYAGYEFARVKRFSFYTAIGGQVDFNTQAIHTESSNSNAYPCLDQMKFRDKKAQFSAQLHLGVAFQLIPHLDLYAEPSLGYYFQNGSKIHSIWHDSPWNVGVSVGLRTSF